MLWAYQECGTACFGDVRLTRRLVSLVADLAECPNVSIPEALGSWAAIKGAYRFFDNKKVTPDSIFCAHREATLERIKDQPVILAIQDTTGLDYSSHPDTEGLGPIGQTGLPLSGYFLHACLAASPEGVPLGILAHRLWVRPPEPKGGSRKDRPLEDKESARWIDMTKEVAKVVPPSTRVVMIGDRESDMFDLLLLANSNHDFLIRARWNRCLAQSEGHLWDTVKKAPTLGQTIIDVPRNDNRPTRKATVTVRAATVTLEPPANRKKENLPAATVNALLIQEVSPPEGVEPIEWRLLTTLPVATFEDALQCLTWYTYRWRIERYFFTLKNGCQLEELQLETKERLANAAAVYSIVAVRLLSLTYHARQSPDEPCTVALSDSEWKALYAATHKTTKVPKTPPDLKTAVLWIAKLGGFIGRKGDGQPGVKVLWRGFRHLEDLTIMWDIFNP
jgi:hypothetical protein